MDIEVDLKPIVHDSTRSLIMVKNDAYIVFSVSDAICAINVIAKLSHAGGPVPQVPFHEYVFETGAGKVTAESSFTRTLGQRYRYDSVAFIACLPLYWSLALRM
jgi:proline racemase